MIAEHIKQKIIDLYGNGLSIANIKKHTGVSEPTISKILKVAGITIRKKNYQKLTIDQKDINRRYQNGESTYSIAKSLNCSDETIRRLITNIRPAAERNKLTPESIQKIATASVLNWQNPIYVEKVRAATSTEEHLAKLSAAGIKNYQTSLGKWLATAESRLTISSRVKELWLDHEYRKKQTIWFQQRIDTITRASKAALANPAKRAEWLRKLRIINADRRQSSGWISSSQKQLYYVLSSSGIEYHEEGPDTRIGPFYVVDCVIPKQQNMIKPLIIEVQGEYWHSLPTVIVRDRQKATYIRKHTDYDLLPLTELQVSSFGEIEQTLARYGLTVRKFECKPTQLTIKKIDEAIASDFYSVFHYTGTIRKGAIVYGAYLNDELMAAISYCYPIRQETTTRLGHIHGEVVEISRLARRTNLICKNLISYFIAKTKAMLPNTIKCIVSFSDSTYGHTGGAYKAAGFYEDGRVPADYHYASINGKYHKKTVWDKAKKMKISEAEYAERHHLLKVPHGEKTRWICRINA